MELTAALGSGGGGGSDDKDGYNGLFGVLENLIGRRRRRGGKTSSSLSSTLLNLFNYAINLAYEELLR